MKYDTILCQKSEQGKDLYIIALLFIVKHKLKALERTMQSEHQQKAHRIIEISPGLI